MFGYASADWPDIYEVIDFNNEYDLYISAPTVNTKEYPNYYGGVYFTREIIYSYTVNNVTYTKGAILDGYINNLNIDYKDSITIIYNINSPNDSRIKATKYFYEIYYLIILTISIGMGLIFKFGNVLPNENYLLNHEVIIHKKRKGKKICLKVLKIEIIDYERERVFFENSEKQLYYYETDFGEDFEINDEYEIILNNSTQKKSKIEYEGNIEKCIQIINIEKKEFFKKT